ncbi:MAG: alkaline phosphatase [Ruminococcaceae bacterium]|nr:alkaline phosphatase [Oscillospiraceae bacterium]
MKLRISALLLALLMTVSVFVGCNNTGAGTVTTTGEPALTTATPAITTATPTTDSTTTATPVTTTEAPVTSEIPAVTTTATTTTTAEVTTAQPDPVPEGISINGVLLQNYKVVFPAEPTVFETYAVNFFVEMIEENTGIKLTSSSDAAEEREYEILVGNTCRDESAEAPDSGYYSLFTSGTKIVCNGQYHLVGAGLYEIADRIPEGTEDIALNVSTSQDPRLHTYKEATSAILIIGDGMGFNTIEMAKANGICPDFYAKALPVHGSVSTLNIYNEITDSAAGATAISCGTRTKNGYLGMDKNGVSIKNVRELAHEKGAKTAVLTTDAITGATPSAFLAHHTSRSDTTILKNQINALISENGVDYCKGSITSGLLTFAKAAIERISADNSKFFIMIEEAHIDKHSHSNDGINASKSVKQLNDVAAYCMSFTVFHPDTALVITADHETGGIRYSSGEYIYTSDDHTAANIPMYACGGGTEVLNNNIINTDTSDFLFSIFE